MKYSLKELEDKLENYLDSKFENGVSVNCWFVHGKPTIRIWAEHFIPTSDSRYLCDNREVELFLHVDNVDYVKIRKALFSLLS